MRSAGRYADRSAPTMAKLPPIKPSRLLWTLLFLGALLVLVNGTVIYAIQTAHHLLDEELETAEA